MKLRIVTSLLLLAGIISYWSLPSHSEQNSKDSSATNEQVREHPTETTPEYQGPSGNSFLTDHASAHTNASQDLKLIGRVIDGATRLFKQLDTRHVATNEQLSAYLTGANPEGLEYLDPTLPIFQDGRLTDRWEQPYIIHPLGTGLLEIRTSGPDKVPYTSDDLRLHPNDGVQGD